MARAVRGVATKKYQLLEVTNYIEASLMDAAKGTSKVPFVRVYRIDTETGKTWNAGIQNQWVEVKEPSTEYNRTNRQVTDQRDSPVLE